MQIETHEKSVALISPSLEPLDVLIADDEPSICETLQLFLHHLGIRNIQTVANGALAVRQMSARHFDFVFVDLMMPEMTGLDVLKRINDDLQLTNVIIMTGYPSMEIVIDAMHHGASDFLIKPFRFEDVKLSLEKILRLRALMERNLLLHRELEKKKEVEELNNQLQKRIRLQTILYHITDSLSKITRSENLYNYVVKQAVEFCCARKACFLIYDQGNSHLLALAQEGFTDIHPGTQALFTHSPDGRRILDNAFVGAHFGVSFQQGVFLDGTSRQNGFMVTPFNIRNEPFGILLVGDKDGKASFDGEDEFILKFLAEKAALNIENMALYDNLKQSLMATLMALVSAIEAKDPYTQQHSSRVTAYAVEFGGDMGCSREELQMIESCGPLHDIGKIGISDHILNKPDRLTQDEFTHIKAHPLIGVNIVSPLGLAPEELALIRNHHERWDGTGYPDGLKQGQIPKLARILAVADAFDAMSADRAYRKALPFQVCLHELTRHSGTQFDPEVVEAALTVLPAFSPQS